jgi:hypothetical protein
MIGEVVGEIGMCAAPKSNLARLGLAFVPWLFPTMSFGQTVVDASFCRSIKNEKECVDAFTHGQTVSLKSLAKNEDGPVIYFSAALRNPSEYRVALIMIRRGPCYSEQAALPEDKFRVNPGMWTGLRKNIATFRVADGLSAFGVKELNVKELSLPKGSPIDLKASVAFITSSDYYRVYGFRNLLCPGEIHARAFDSEGNPIPGANEVKTLYVTQ